MYFANKNDHSQYVNGLIYQLSFNMERLDKYVKAYEDIIKSVISYGNAFTKVNIMGMEFKLDYSIRFDLSIRGVDDIIKIHVPATNGKQYPKNYIDSVEIEFRDEKVKKSLYEFEFTLNSFVTKATKKFIKIIAGTNEYSFETDCNTDETTIMTRTNEILGVQHLSEIVFKNLLEYIDYQQNYVEHNGYAYQRGTQIYSNNTLIFSAA